ncbi:MAG: hypothetical protein ACRDT0_15565 [Pseudonocardiaceae bacterium]
MLAASGGFTADPRLLQQVGGEIVGLAQNVHATASELSGQSTALAGSNAGFACQQALVACERAWEQAIDAASARLALDGDRMVACGQDYARSEAAAFESLRLDWTG